MYDATPLMKRLAVRRAQARRSLPAAKSKRFAGNRWRRRGLSMILSVWIKRPPGPWERIVRRFRPAEIPDPPRPVFLDTKTGHSLVWGAQLEIGAHHAR